MTTHGRRLAAAFGLTLILIPGLTGCAEPRVRAQGERGVAATYTHGTLTAMLEEPMRVQAVIAAAGAVVRGRGYSVSREESTEEAGTLEARPPRTTDWPKVTIEATRAAEGTRVDISVSLFGDEELSRSILDGILKKLGE